MKRLGAVLLCAGCGYQPIYAARASEQLCVRAAPPRIAELAAPPAAVRGAMRTLQRAGALAPDETRDPCMVVELLRVTERPTGMGVASTRAGEQPRATGNEVWVTGRAWVERSGKVSRDTGDVRRSARGAVSAPVSDSQRYRALVTAAAEDLGQALAERILGLPVVDLGAY